MRDNNHIHSVERALKILEIFGESLQPLSLTEVANLANLTKTTTQRFINTLIVLGYLNREENKRYFLGTKVLSLGFQYLNSSSLIAMAKPYLDELSSELQMTVNLGVLDKGEVLILYRREVKKFLRFDIHPGSKLLGYGSALGRVLLAGLSDRDIADRLNAMDIQKLTPKTITSKQAIMEEIVKTREHGYAVSDQEQTMDLCSIAAPLLDEKKETVAVINVSLDVMRRNDPVLFENAKTRLINKGESISRRLGYGGPYPVIHVLE